MHGSYRCIILAAFGWLILAGASPPDQAQKKGATSAEHSATVPTASNQAGRPEIGDSRCYRDPDSTKADLCAQWRADVAAEKAAQIAEHANALTYAGNWIAGIGGGLTALSLLFVILALKQTERSLGEARSANMISEDTAKRQLRAYLAVTMARVEGMLVGGRPRYMCTIKNNGATPAFDVQYIGQIFVGARASPPPIRFIVSFVIKRDIAPGEEWPIEYWPEETVSADFHQEVAANRVAVTYAGIVRYRDAFGRRRYTTFKRRVHPYYLREGAGNLLVEAKGNRGN
ncbi:MAG: hypothetical protein V4475_07160 [Pseudomonadota bacterium]